MKAQNLIVRCYVEKAGAVWQAFCLDLNLAAQGDSMDDAKARLDDMIDAYVYDALAGDDQDYAGQLLPRRAPLYFWLKYYWYKLGCCAKNGFNRPFRTKLPLVPKVVH